MQSSNIELRKAYFAALNTITYNGLPVPCYFQQLPTPITPGVYITFGQIRNNDISDKSAHITSTSVTVSIFTNDIKYNDGVAVEEVTNEVFKKIYKEPHFNLSLGGSFFQILQTTLESDYIAEFSQDQQNIYIDRILIFNHTIFQNVS
jgi:hypothetical protein